MMTSGADRLEFHSWGWRLFAAPTAFREIGLPPSRRTPDPPCPQAGVLFVSSEAPLPKETRFHRADGVEDHGDFARGCDCGLLIPLRPLSRTAHDLSDAYRLTCVINVVAADKSSRRISKCGDGQIRRDLSISPD